MKFIVSLSISLLLVGCNNSVVAKHCVDKGWDGIVSSNHSQYCSNGLLTTDGQFITEAGVVSKVIKGEQRFKYIKLEEVKE